MRARTLGAIGALALQVTLVLAVLLMVAFDRPYYSAQYERLGVYKSCGADAQTLERATDITLGYLRGELPDMSGEGTIDGVTRQIFGADERIHMEDVKGLFVLALKVLLASGAVAAACMLLAGRDRRATAQGALMGMAVFLALLGAGAAWCMADFTGAFMAFHRLLFRNGLWMMDPDTQFMIRMFPARFFYDMGMRIAATVAVCMTVEAAAVCMTGFGGRKKHGIQ